MKKKLLQSLDIIPKEWGPQEKRWLIDASIIDAKGERVLAIDIYDSMNVIDVYPKYRLFITDKEDACFEVKTGNWSSKKIESIIQTDYRSGSACHIEPDSTANICEFFSLSSSQEDVIWRIKNYQESIRSKKYNRGLELRGERINKVMNDIDDIPLPDDFDTFVDEAFSDVRYIFYSAEKNKRYIKTYCSHCDKIEVIDSRTVVKPKHNTVGQCNHCGSNIIFKVSGRTNSMKDIKEVIYMHKYDKGFVSRYFDVIRRSSYQSQEQYKYYEKARVVYNGQNIKEYYGHENYYNNKISWWDRNGNSYEGAIKFGYGVLYHKNLNTVFEETTFKYCALGLLAEHRKNQAIHQSAFLRAFESNRFLENFIKMGLFNLTDDFVCRRSTLTIDSKGKNAMEILKISKQSINRLIALDGNLYTLKLLQIEEKEGMRFTDEQKEYMSEHLIDIELLEHVLKYTTVHKALSYLKVIAMRANIHNILRDWVDYIRNCETLHYDLRNEFVLFPRNFKAAHDNAASGVLEIENAHKDKEFKSMVKDMIKKYMYETKEIAIVVPSSVKEIIEEGQKLHHCVGTYIDRILKKETMILFVRQKEDINKSFYTLEVKNGIVAQCRGKNNCDMTPRVRKFVKGFENRRLKPKEVREAV